MCYILAVGDVPYFRDGWCAIFRGGGCAIF